MLSDEEKKAFQYYKECNEKDLENYEYLHEVTQKQTKYLEILLNLIEKQSKEIEELNKENTRQHELIGNIHQKWQDKIKAKIEELNKKYKAIESNYTEQAIDAGDIEADDYVEMQSIQYADDILQSLLEKE